MSLPVLNAVFEHPEGLTHGERVVLLNLAHHADDTGLAWPSVETIAAECGMGRRTVQRALRRLEDVGWIKTDLGGDGPRQSSHYWVQRPAVRAAQGPPLTGAEQVTSKSGVGDAKGVVGGRKGRRRDRPNYQGTTRGTTKNPQSSSSLRSSSSVASVFSPLAAAGLSSDEEAEFWIFETKRRADVGLEPIDSRSSWLRSLAATDVVALVDRFRAWARMQLDDYRYEQQWPLRDGLAERLVAAGEDPTLSSDRAFKWARVAVEVYVQHVGDEVALPECDSVECVQAEIDRLAAIRDERVPDERRRD
jgi:hypothetical protein